MEQEDKSHSSQGWAKLEPGTQNVIRVSSAGTQGLKISLLHAEAHLAGEMDEKQNTGMGGCNQCSEMGRSFHQCWLNSVHHNADPKVMFLGESSGVVTTRQTHVTTVLPSFLTFWTH